MSPTRRSGPALLPETATDEVPATVTAIVQPPADLDHHRQRTTDLVAIVQTFGDKSRRTSYLSLEPARRAVERAHQRGIEVSIDIYDLTGGRAVQLNKGATR